jgi:hypothetical protein
VHNGGLHKIKQNDTSTALLDNLLFSSDGINFDQRLSNLDLWSRTNWLYNTIIDAPSPSEINGVLTWAQDKEWTAQEYDDMIAWLASQGSNTVSLVP